MDWKKIADRAKQQIDKRGGTEGLKQDATKLREIATRKGSITDKAKEAADALKRPAEGTAAAESTAATEPASSAAAGSAEAPTGPEPASAATPSSKSAEEKRSK